MTNQLVRDNEVVHTSKVDVFEFDQQGAFLVQQEPYEVKPGDAFRTSCYYRDGAEFGVSSQEEMCIAYVMYYPAKATSGMPWFCPYGFQIPLCSQDLQRFDLEDVQGLDRVFGSSNGQCGANAAPSPGPTLAPTTSRAGSGGANETSSSGRTGINMVVFAAIASVSFLLIGGI